MVNRLRNPQLQKVSAVETGVRIRPVIGAVAWGFLLICLALNCRDVTAQWKQVPANSFAVTGINPTGATGTMLLLSNGTVMVHGVDFPIADSAARYSDQWYLLSPDSAGDYATGSWTLLNNMQAYRVNFSSWVLPNGKVVIAGGQFEFNTASTDVEIYDPLAGTWKQSTQPYPGGGSIGASPSVLLGSSQILFGDYSSPNTYLYTPGSDRWTISGQKASWGIFPNFPDANSNGQAFTLMSNGGVLTWPISENRNIVNSVQYFQIPNWAQSTYYSIGNVVFNNPNYYVCVNTTENILFNDLGPGLSNFTGNGPQSTGTNIQDLDVHWSSLAPWSANKSYLLYDSVYVNGNVYTCVKPGTSGAGIGPTGQNSKIVDGSVTWQWQSSFNVPFGQIYGGGQWSNTTFCNPILADPQHYDPSSGVLALGPASVMPDGSVIQFGGNGKSAIYDRNGNWKSGPTFPNGVGPDFAPGAMLPNGKFLMAVDSIPGQLPPAQLYLYDYSTNPPSLSKLTAGIPAGLASDLQTNSSAYMRMLVLPNGHVLLNIGNGNIWDYNPGGQANSAWAPTISGPPAKNTTGVYTLQGTRLTGISAGACYGAYAQMATNYPIVRLSNGAGNVRYATTTNWTPGISDAGNGTMQSVVFQLPTGFSTGTYSLSVIANGIPSSPQVFTVPVASENYVTASYSPANQIVTLTGDNENNVVSLTLKNQVLTIAGGGACWRKRRDADPRNAARRMGFRHDSRHINGREFLDPARYGGCWHRRAGGDIRRGGEWRVLDAVTKDDGQVRSGHNAECQMDGHFNRSDSEHIESGNRSRDVGDRTRNCD